MVNKLDLLPPHEREQFLADLLEKIQWDGAVFGVSAASGEGTDVLCSHIMEYLEACAAREADDPDLVKQELAEQRAMQAEGRQRIVELRELRRDAAISDEDDGFDDEDDDHDVEVVYAE